MVRLGFSLYDFVWFFRWIFLFGKKNDDENSDGQRKVVEKPIAGKKSERKDLTGKIPAGKILTQGKTPRGRDRLEKDRRGKDRAPYFRRVVEMHSLIKCWVIAQWERTQSLWWNIRAWLCAVSGSVFYDARDKGRTASSCWCGKWQSWKRLERCILQIFSRGIGCINTMK